MAIITHFAYYHSVCKETKSEETKSSEGKNPHKTAEFVGKTLAALAVVGGLISIYALSIYGILGKGPFTPLRFAGNCALTGTLAGLELLTILGLALKALGCDKKKEKYTHIDPYHEDSCEKNYAFSTRERFKHESDDKSFHS